VELKIVLAASPGAYKLAPRYADFTDGSFFNCSAGPCAATRPFSRIYP
jgi:hypothetical protein